jgi:hypothetical protein
MTKNIATTLGVLFIIVGGLGFAMPDLGSGPDGMLTVVPGQLMLGMVDHIVHIIAGAVFLFAGLYRKPILAGPPMP